LVEGVATTTSSGGYIQSGAPHPEANLLTVASDLLNEKANTKTNIVSKLSK
jgi:hypothetical protein